MPVEPFRLPFGKVNAGRKCRNVLGPYIVTRCIKSSNLSLEVDNPVSFGFGQFKYRTCFARKELHGSIFLLKDIFWSVVKDKPCALLVGLEAKFFSDKANFYIRFVSAKYINFGLCKGRYDGPYALQMHASADSRSRSTNMSMRYAPMFGVSR